MANDVLDSILKQNSIDAVFITDPYSLRYYTGFRGGEGYAFATSKGSRVLITDSRYTEAAGMESEFEVKEFGAKVPMKDILTEFMKSNAVHKLGFESLSISYNDYKHPLYYLLLSCFQYYDLLNIRQLDNKYPAIDVHT